jgi:hypothetical protein
MTKCLFPIPDKCLGSLKEGKETGIGYQVVSVERKDGTVFDQVLVSEFCIIEVRGHSQIPFALYEVASVSVGHKRWNFRDESDARLKARATWGEK